MSRIVGIDLGTSTSEIAYINDKGLPQLIPNHHGEYITPSVVYMNEKSHPLVGLEAKEQILQDPENTFMEVKRLIGTDSILNARGKTYTPTEVSAFILRYLVDCAETHLNEKIENAVITVPAYFTDIQRKQTLEAGESIGLTVERIINEPTAASLDYGIMHMDECKYIMVYDLGGGTLDVTVMELFEGIIDVKSSCGNNSLGGKDFDQAIINYLVDKINKEYKVDLSQDIRAMMRIKKASEECKIALSTDEEFIIDLPFLYNKKGQPIGLSETITRVFFESLVQEMIFSTADQIKRALSEAALMAEDLDLVLLVGGSTKIPLVTNFLLDEFDLSPKTLIDPDLGVVRGAAIQAGIINGDFKENEIILTDVCPYSLSTDVLRGDIFGFGDIECDILIKRNTTIPVTEQKIYVTSHDGQKEVHISVYQGESTVPEENNLLNVFKLSGIPSAKAGKEKIKIIFSYDLNSILTVTAEIVSNGKMATVEIDTTKIVKNIDLSEWKDAKDAKKYRTIINKAEKHAEQAGIFEKNDIYLDLFITMDSLKKALILEQDKEVLESLKEELLEIIYELED